MPSPTEPTTTEDEPRRPPRVAPPTDQEVWFGQNLARLREKQGISQSGLARAMAGQGFTFHQTTISRIEAGERPVRLAEATALAELVGAGVGDLTRPPDAAEAIARVGRAMRKVTESLQGTEDYAALAVLSKDSLKHALEQARRAGVFEEVTKTVERLLDIEPEEAVRRGRERAENFEKVEEYREAQGQDYKTGRDGAREILQIILDDLGHSVSMLAASINVERGLPEKAEVQRFREAFERELDDLLALIRILEGQEVGDKHPVWKRLRR